MSEGSRGYYVIPDYCLICGEPVPEGRQVCPQCEYVIMHSTGRVQTQLKKQPENRPGMPAVLLRFMKYCFYGDEKQDGHGKRKEKR